MDYDSIDTDFWHEIQDAPGEIFEIPELWEDVDPEQSFNEFVNSDVTL
jgi:hypothetical protein